MCVSTVIQFIWKHVAVHIYLSIYIYIYIYYLLYNVIFFKYIILLNVLNIAYINKLEASAFYVISVIFI